MLSQLLILKRAPPSIIVRDLNEHFCFIAPVEGFVLQTEISGKYDTYTLFDGLAYNTCGYFASCVVFFRAPQGRGKIRAMSKMSARIIC